LLAHITTTPILGADPSALVTAFITGGIGLVLVIVAMDRLGMLSNRAVLFRRWTGLLAAALSVGAAIIHIAVIETHQQEYPPFGVAFAALALFQVVWAMAVVVSSGRLISISGVVVNTGALIAWAVSRTVGLPMGPDPGVPEEIGSLDIAAVALEIALVALLAWSARRPASGDWRVALPAQRAAVVLGSCALAIVFVTTAALVVPGGDIHTGLGHQERDTANVSATPPPIGALPILPFVPASPDPGPSGQSIGPRPTSRAPQLTPTPGRMAVPVASPALPASSPPVPASPTAGGTSAPRPTRSPVAATPTPRGPTVTLEPTTTPVPAAPGIVRFGSSFDASGEIAVPDDAFGEGDQAVWVATFSRVPGVASVRLEIVQVLTDGRQFEHWREDMVLSDPSSRRLAGEAVLSIYVHGGEGSYRLRYLVGDELLAEGAFEMTP
jgi:hypothetical protein